MTKTVETFETAALELLNAGFASKAAQKKALDEVSRAYEIVKREIANALLADRSIGGENWNDLYYGPLYIHEFSEKRQAAYLPFFPEQIAIVRRLRELRDAIKSAAIVPPAKDEAKAVEKRVVEAIKARMERLGVRFLEAINLCEVCEDFVAIKGLSANSHYVTNDRGTTFLRTFYYLNGKLTPLNLIIAAAEEAARQAKAA